MNTIELSEVCDSSAVEKTHSSSGLGRLASAVIRYWINREALRTLKRQSPYMLRDIGFEPDEIYGARPAHLDNIDAGRRSSRRS